jgi:polysaccharide export outer membrane protein
VDTRGFISVPYAGLVPAAGKRPSQVEAEIVNRIKNRAIEPQAVVALVTQNSSLITVIGEINTVLTNTTGRVVAQPSGERILDVITRAGGLKDQGQDTWVVLERNGRRATVPFGSLIYEPGNNIWAWPGDTVYLYKEPQSYLVFGASGQQGQFPFSTSAQLTNPASAWRMTLAEGIAAATGIADAQGDPGSVFLFRREPRELAEKLGVDCSTRMSSLSPMRSRSTSRSLRTSSIRSLACRPIPLGSPIPSRAIESYLARPQVQSSPRHRPNRWARGALRVRTFGRKVIRG